MDKVKVGRIVWQWCIGIPSGPALVLDGLEGREGLLNGVILALGNNERASAAAALRAINGRRLALGLLPIIAAFWDR